MTVKSARTALYRLYDARGDLLYVGITNNTHRRWGQHELCQPWWHLVRDTSVQWFEDRGEVETAEVVAIETERPRFNVEHVPELRIDTGQYDDTADRRRVQRLLRRDVSSRYIQAGRSFFLADLAARYRVSRITVWSVMHRLDERSFTTRRQRVTFHRTPDFEAARKLRHVH